MVKEQIFLETNKGNVDDKNDDMRKKYNISPADLAYESNWNNAVEKISDPNDTY